MDLPPGITTYKDRHGKTRYRFRRKGLATQDIPGQPGTDEFEAACLRAAAGITRRARLPTAGTRTLRAAWIEIIDHTPEWKQLKASSKAQQIGVAERFLKSRINSKEPATFATVPIASLRRGDVKKIIARYSDRPHAGEAVLRLLRKLCLVALDLEWIENDPTSRVKFRPKLKGHRAWTDEEMAQYEARWPVGTRNRLGYALALYTGQRRADVAAMSEAAYANGAIAVVQEKTGTTLWIPAHPELVTVLDATNRAGPWLIVAAHGGRLTTESFGNEMADAIGQAGLPDDCRLHGLRKSAGRCLAEAGCTAHQIMAILGHKSLAEAQKYTEAARQKMLAQQGMDNWSRPKLTMINGGK